LKSLVNGAVAAGAPLLLAAVSVDGKPVVSFRGSAQVHSDDQIGLRACRGQGGTLEAIRANPNGSDEPCSSPA
jgi:phosphoribosylformylglycinamidine (FGAM) synthase-like amidotransferase family enzyme